MENDMLKYNQLVDVYELCAKVGDFESFDRQLPLSLRNVFDAFDFIEWCEVEGLVGPVERTKALINAGLYDVIQ